MQIRDVFIIEQFQDKSFEPKELLTTDFNKILVIEKGRVYARL
jgi:hypothetical protein